MSVGRQEAEIEGLRRLTAFQPAEGATTETHETISDSNNLTFRNNRELLNIAVEIGEGRSANILIREMD